MDKPPDIDKHYVYILLAIGTIIGGIFMKLPKIPWWLVLVGALIGGALSVAAFETHSMGDFILGAAAGTLGPYLIANAIEVFKKYLAKRAGVSSSSSDKDTDRE